MKTLIVCAICLVLFGCKKEPQVQVPISSQPVVVRPKLANNGYATLEAYAHEEDANSIFRIKEGGTIVVALPEGDDRYKWVPLEISPNIAKLTDESKKVVGPRTSRVFRFRVVGDGVISFVYENPWETPKHPQKQVSYAVELERLAYRITEP